MVTGDRYSASFASGAASTSPFSLPSSTGTVDVVAGATEDEVATAVRVVVDDVAATTGAADVDELETSLSNGLGGSRRTISHPILRYVRDISSIGLRATAMRGTLGILKLRFASFLVGVGAASAVMAIRAQARRAKMLCMVGTLFSILERLRQLMEGERLQFLAGRE